MSKQRDRVVFQVGDKVAYSVQFLRSIGMSHSDMAHARGVVIALTDETRSWRLATIKWDREMPERANVHNLAKVGLNRRFSNVN